MNYLRSGLFIILALIPFAHASNIPSDLPIVHRLTNDFKVLDVKVDHYSRLWLAGGTKGLALYDGSQLSPITVSGVSRAYYIANAGDKMYVAFLEGVYQFDVATLDYEKIIDGQFGQIAVVDDILVGIYSGNSSLTAFDIKANQFIALNTVPADMNQQYYGLTLSMSGDLYFYSMASESSSSALFRFNRQQNLKWWRPDPLNDFISGPQSLSFLALAIKGDNSISIFAQDNSILSFDPVKEEFHSHTKVKVDNNGLRDGLWVGNCLFATGTNGLFSMCDNQQRNYSDQYSSFQQLPNKHLNSMQYDSQQKLLWVKSFGGNLIAFHLAKMPFQHNFKGGLANLQDNESYAVFYDRDATMWVGSNGYGINSYHDNGDQRYYSLNIVQDKPLHIISFYQLTDESLLAGTIDGYILHLLPDAADFSLLVESPFTAPVSNFSQHGNMLFFTTLRTLYQYDLASNEIVKFWDASDFFNGSVLLDLEIVENKAILATQSGLMVFDLLTENVNRVNDLLPDGARCDQSLHQLARYNDDIMFKGGGLCRFSTEQMQVQLVSEDFPPKGNLFTSENGISWTFDGYLHRHDLSNNTYDRLGTFQGFLPSQPSQGFNTLHGHADKVVLAHSFGISHLSEKLDQPNNVNMLPKVFILPRAMQRGNNSSQVISPGTSAEVHQSDRLVKASFDVVNYFPRVVRYRFSVGNSPFVIVNSLQDVFLPLDDSGSSRVTIEAIDELNNVLGSLYFDYYVTPFWYNNALYQLFALTLLVIFVLLAWRYREHLLATRRNLLKVTVAEKTSELTREISHNQLFTRNLIKLIQEDTALFSDKIFKSLPPEKDGFLDPELSSIFTSLNNKVHFGRMVNDRFLPVPSKTELLNVNNLVYESINFLVVLYHDYFGKVQFKKSESSAFEAYLPRELINIVISKLLFDAFLIPAETDEVVVNLSVKNDCLCLSVSLDLMATPVKKVNRNMLRHIYSYELNKYYCDYLSAADLEFVTESSVGEWKTTAFFNHKRYKICRNIETSSEPKSPFDQNNQFDVIAHAKIMIIDDNDFMLNLLADKLVRYTVVHSYNDAESAIYAFDQIKPDAVVVDLHLPGMSGFQLCNWIREHKVYHRVPVFIMSGDDDRNMLIPAANIGATDFFIKPIDFELLMAKLCFHLLSKPNEHYFISDASTVANEVAMPFADIPSASVIKDLSQKYSRVSASSDFIKKLFDAIDEIIPDPDKKIDDLASKFHSSPRNFRRKVASELRMSPKELLKIRRLQSAAELLKTTDISISEISFRCGYSSQSNFNRQFKDLFNCAPLEYRKNNINGLESSSKRTGQDHEHRLNS